MHRCKISYERLENRSFENKCANPYSGCALVISLSMKLGGLFKAIKARISENSMHRYTTRTVQNIQRHREQALTESSTALAKEIMRDTEEPAGASASEPMTATRPAAKRFATRAARLCRRAISTSTSVELVDGRPALSIASSWLSVILNRDLKVH